MMLGLENCNGSSEWFDVGFKLSVVAGAFVGIKSESVPGTFVTDTVGESIVVTGLGVVSGVVIPDGRSCEWFNIGFKMPVVAGSCGGIDCDVTPIKFGFTVIELPLG
mmetsp:Transcript_25797/g.46733  ORF Transcript_25797/g.46733 Transcript_25797/m.46733 type:complete len:107 (-) Transcript_25797:64-384(-)